MAHLDAGADVETGSFPDRRQHLSDVGRQPRQSQHRREVGVTDFCMSGEGLDGRINLVRDDDTTQQREDEGPSTSGGQGGPVMTKMGQHLESAGEGEGGRLVGRQVLSQTGSVEQMTTEVAGHFPFEFEGRESQSVTGVRLARCGERLREIVAIPSSVVDGMARGQAMSCAIKGDTTQETRVVRLGSDRRIVAVQDQPRLHVLPECFIDDGRVLAGIDHVFVSNLSAVERVDPPPAFALLDLVDRRFHVVYKDFTMVRKCYLTKFTPQPAMPGPWIFHSVDRSVASEESEVCGQRVYKRT